MHRRIIEHLKEYCKPILIKLIWRISQIKLDSPISIRYSSTHAANNREFTNILGMNKASKRGKWEPIKHVKIPLKTLFILLVQCLLI